MSARGGLQLVGIHKQVTSGGSARALFSDLNLVIPKRHFIAILGVSGCGKSTLLRMFAGFVHPDQGQVLFDGRPIDGPVSGIGYMSQSYDLLAWKSVIGNVTLGLARSGLSKSDRLARANQLLRTVKLETNGRARPDQLSGGMRQRVALARTLAQDPHVLLLDEPFGALAVGNRRHLGTLVRDLYTEGKVGSVVFVTHDVEDAVRLADEVVVLGGTPTSIVFRARPEPGAAVANAELLAHCRTLV